ncbi:hypothetical protein AR687_09320 [Flavobacteriaceae bacterium CRH]|nr:hypothetical protein AR687_09320 [Flavobacteriaceae bacterium CRH]
MKKLLPFFGALALMFTSCSSDDNDASASIKPSKINHIYPDASDNYLTDVKYDGNKLVSETDSDGYNIKYTYTGDVITKKEEFNSSNQLQTTTEYTYANGKLSASLLKQSNREFKSTVAYTYYKIKYTYNADGTVSWADFYVNISTGEEEAGNQTGKYTYKDGNLITSESSFYSQNSTYTYEYDAKNNPSKNITGASLLLDWEETAAANNVVKITLTSSGIVTKSSDASIFSTHTYTYNSDNFPTEDKSYNSEGQLGEVTQFTY